MSGHYDLKIDKRKKLAIEHFEHFYKTDLSEKISKGEVYVNEAGDDYVTKEFAKKYLTYDDAVDEMSEEFEIVSKS